MDSPDIITEIKKVFADFSALSVSQNYTDEINIKVSPRIFRDTCFTLHKILSSPVMMLFACDQRRDAAKFAVNCVFVSSRLSKWVIVSIDIPQDCPSFESLAKSIYSASLFERQIYEMFGIKPEGNPDLRRLNLHDEVWPQGNYPMRKDFQKIQGGNTSEYRFSRVEGDGIFEVPVGPVHAGIIGPGHFRFSVAGEPVINLEARLGWAHRGVEKLFEGKPYNDAVRISECVSGDSAFAHSLAFTQAAEKISGVSVPARAIYLRAVFLEFERIYNHINGIGGIAIDAAFSFPAAFASVIKESVLRLNELLTASRYLKNVNVVGGVLTDLDESKKKEILGFIRKIRKDFVELKKILNSSVSFMDRVDSTGVLKRKTAGDLGVTGLAARASGIPIDLRKYFSGVYNQAGFKIAVEESGDVLARLRIRFSEFEESCRLIEEFTGKLAKKDEAAAAPELKEGSALGYAEGWRGPVIYWLKTGHSGLIERCKIVDPSFLNWQGLCYAVLGNIIPDFPLCNKSFDLSYSGNDL